MDARRRLLAMSLTGLFVPGVAAARDEASITVRVYNLSHLPAPLVSDAAAEANRVLRRAGIGVQWVMCSSADHGPDERCSTDLTPVDLLVRLQDDTAALGSHVCGISLLPSAGHGRLISLFMRCVRDLSDRLTVPVHTVLAYCLVHELGHQLLSTRAHDPDGLMAASLSAMDWRRAAAGRLWFSSRQAEQLRAGLAARTAAMLNARSSSPAR